MLIFIFKFVILLFRNEVVSTNNQMDEVKMNQVENEKSGNKSLIEKYVLEINKCIIL